MLHPFHPNLLLLLSQLEGDRHDHLDGDRLIVQIRRFILPFLQRIECGLIQEGRSGDDLHLYDVPLFIQNCVDLHLTLNVHLPREWRIFGLYFYDYFRRSYVPTNAYGTFRLNGGRRGNRPRRGIQHSTNHSAEHSTHLPNGYTAPHSAGYSTKTPPVQKPSLHTPKVTRHYGRRQAF